AFGAWVDAWNVMRPLSHSAAAQRGSIGVAQTRWLTMRCFTTVSAPSKTSATDPNWRSTATLVPASGNNSVSFFSAASIVLTAGRGEYSTTTDSAASGPW